jgi:hypothetical protein
MMKVYRHKELGHLVEMFDGADLNAEIIRFYPQGGGFERTMHRVPFFDFYEPAPAPYMRRGTVDADFLDGPATVPCWADDRRWNGWGMPYFTRETVNQLIEMGIGPIQWDGEKVVCRMGDDPEDIEIYEPITAPDGTPIWGVGAGSWCWNGVEFPPQPNAYEMGREAYRKGVREPVPASDPEFMATIEGLYGVPRSVRMADWSSGYHDEKNAATRRK